MRDWIIFILVLTGLVAGTSSLTTSTNTTTSEDIEKPHVKIPGS